MVQAIQARREAVHELCRRLQVARLDIFGSAATGRLREDSDLDLVVVFQPTPSMSPADQYFGLLAALEDLFGREVDLLTERSLRNPYFAESVRRTRQPLYAA
jgi:predicted nucleotidyltransferase